MMASVSRPASTLAITRSCPGRRRSMPNVLRRRLPTPRGIAPPDFAARVLRRPLFPVTALSLRAGGVLVFQSASRLVLKLVNAFRSLGFRELVVELFLR